MTTARTRTWLLLASLLLAAVAVTWYSLVPWLAHTYWLNGPQYPPDKVEREVITSWRETDRRDSEPMRAVPFRVAVRAPTAEVETITIENTSSRVARNLWFYREDMPNFYNAATIVESVTAGKQTQTEKVLALWALFPRYYYNYYPLSSSGLLIDPPTLFAVLGTAQCNYAAAVLETLCQMIGCETRLIGVELNDPAGNIAHCVLEVKADGRWIYMDPDGHAIYRRPDGEWAGVADLMNDPEIVRHAPHAYYNPSLLGDAFARGTVTFLDEVLEPFELARRQRDPTCYSAYHHAMRYDLLPGSKIVLSPHRKGRFYSMNLPLYCNGVLRWTYRPEDFANGKPHGVILENLTVRTRQGDLLLMPQRRGTPASLILPLSSPYLMVGGRIVSQVEAHGDMRLYILPFARCVLSSLEGWTRLGSCNKESTLSFDNLLQAAPVFGYALKIEVPESGALLHAFEVHTWLQGAPKALPYLTPGENRFILYCQTPTSPLATQGGEADVESVLFDNGLKLSFSLLKTLTSAPERRATSPVATQVAGTSAGP